MMKNMSKSKSKRSQHGGSSTSFRGVENVTKASRVGSRAGRSSRRNRDGDKDASFRIISDSSVKSSNPSTNEAPIFLKNRAK